MSFIRTLVFLPAFLALVKSDFPVDYEDLISRNEVDPPSYRLPENLDPVHYDVEITPYFEAEPGKEAFTFDGIVTLTVRAVEEDVKVLTIQENVREIVSVTLTDESGRPILLNETLPFERVRAYHFLRVYLRDGVTLTNQQNYILTVVYIGNINETPLSRGIFRGYYNGSDGRTHWYAASHLQPVNSRQAFPSFDEPGFKSTFTIIINRPGHFTESYSNMRIAEQIRIGNRVKEIFHPTPRMSAYLISVHISEEFTVIADNLDPIKPYRILARPNSLGQGRYAMEVGPPITEWLEDYFGIPYYTMGENMKNDQIAVPDWASGATENWGLVSYRELRLLYEDGETNALDKMNIGTITAHELAHKWFGNLITCRWWDNVWINEGFASYFEYFAMNGVDPSLELEDQFNIMYVQSALSADSGVNTRALQHTVNSPAEVTGHFSGISYSKGASLLLMLKHFVTEATFKKALNLFLVDRAYEHAFPVDIYRAFAQAVAEDRTVDPSVNMTAFVEYWVEEPGYPILNVNVDMDTGLISLQQERFYLSPNATPSNQVWPLPLTYVTQNNRNWQNLTPSHVMTTSTATIQKEAEREWVIFNVQQKGLYRVNYDRNNWEMLASTMRLHPDNISHLNRAQIVDDVFALMRSEKISYEFGFHVLEFLKQDSNYYVWYPAVSGFTWIRNRFLHLPDVLAEFDSILYEYLERVIADVSYFVRENERLSTTLNRFFILTFACNIGHEGCIENAKSRFAAFRNNGTNLNPNLRRHVLCVGLREGTYEDWQFFYQRRINSNNQADMVAMLRALGCTTNERALREHMASILDDNVVKAQDRVNAFTFVYAGHRQNTRVALEFIKERIDDIRRAAILQNSFNSILSGLASYMDEDGLVAMEEWLEDNRASIPEYSVGINAIASARSTMQWGTDRAEVILEAVRGSAIVVLPTTMLLFTTVIAMFLK